jgi:hypothetical protein
MNRTHSAALPFAHMVLRLLMVLNWMVFAAIVVLLVAMPTREWIMNSLNLTPSPEADQVVSGMRAIAVIGLVMMPIYHLILKRLLAIVETVRAGDPFVATNAARLQAIAWAMAGLQLCGFVISLIVERISTPGHPVDIDAGISISACLAIVLIFVLARVFAEGARMRDDLAGTV